VAIYFPPPPPHIGASQPLTPSKLTPPTGAAPVIDQPFSRGWLLSILAYPPAIPLPYQARKLSPGIPGQSVDNPPNRAADLRAALVSWQPPQPAQTFYAKFTQGIDNPPFGLPPRWRFDAPPIPAQVQYPRYIHQAAVIAADNPPFGMPPAWLFGTLGQWQLTPPTPIRYNRLVQEFVAAAAEKPPFNQTWLWGILSQWQAAYSIVQARQLSPGIPGQSVDLPPSRTTVNFITQVKAWEPSVIIPQRQIYLPQPVIVASVDNPPLGMPPDWLYSVLTTSWQPGAPLPKVLQKILQEGAAPVIASGQREKRKWRRSSS